MTNQKSNIESVFLLVVKMCLYSYVFTVIVMILSFLFGCPLPSFLCCEGMRYLRTFYSVFSWSILMFCWITCCQSYRIRYPRDVPDQDSCMNELIYPLLDDQFSASTYVGNGSIFQPHNARILDIHSQSSPSDGRAWCPATAVHTDQSEWIEVDFRRITFLRVLYTMGRGDGNFKRFCPEVLIKYQSIRNGPWFTYRDIHNETVMPINTDARTKIRTTLKMIVATTIRLYPLSVRDGPKLVCLKFEFLGCSSDEPSPDPRIAKAEDRRNSTETFLSSPHPDHSFQEYLWRKKNFSFLIVIGLVIVLMGILLGCVAFFFWKMKRVRQLQFKKKMEYVVKFPNRDLYDPSSRMALPSPSKNHSITGIVRQTYYSDTQGTASNYCRGSQLNDGTHTSWPNTDDSTDVSRGGTEEEKCLLEDGQNDKSSTNKDYAIYQPGASLTRSEYLNISRPTSTLVTSSNDAGYSESPIGHCKIVPLFDGSVSTATVINRTDKDRPLYLHLINYRGVCGDVDVRYQRTVARTDHPDLYSSIQIVPTTSIVSVKSWIKGQFGVVDLVSTTAANNDTGHFYMKTLYRETPTHIKSKFILDLRILSELQGRSFARLTAIVVDADLLREDVSSLIKSARFSLLVERTYDRCLKGFLQSLHLSDTTQIPDSVAVPFHSKVSTSFKMLIVTQVSRALRHLEELDLIHRDIGCRNCAIDSKGHITLYPGGYLTSHSSEDYSSFELDDNFVHVPLRWMAPESLSTGVYTTKSDVWSFGITMWEVFTLCSLVPYSSMTDEILLQLLLDRHKFPMLTCPRNCPQEIFDLMSQCCSWNASLRPQFLEVHLFLQIKSPGSVHPSQFVLPSPPTTSMDH